MTPGQAVILAVIEGFSEFLPISSTGHMILASSAMGIAEQEITKMFTVCIQFGAILSVLVLYGRRFFQSKAFYAKLVIAFLPAAVMGRLLNHWIDLLLEDVCVVAVALLIGGIIFLFVDRWFQEFPGGKAKDKEVSCRTAFWIGCVQTFSLIPGVSRSAATIIGGLAQNLTRQAATEFSFFLAVPTMFAAACYKLYLFYQSGERLGSNLTGILLIGNLVAFGIALLAIKSFIAYLTGHGFRIFGYYRILVGLTILGLHFSGIKFHF